MRWLSCIENAEGRRNVNPYLESKPVASRMPRNDALSSSRQKLCGVTKKGIFQYLQLMQTIRIGQFAPPAAFLAFGSSMVLLLWRRGDRTQFPPSFEKGNGIHGLLASATPHASPLETRASFSVCGAATRPLKRRLRVHSQKSKATVSCGRRNYHKGEP